METLDKVDPSGERSAWNRARFDPHNTLGHYESYFQRANHPSRPLAFWIRYTVFSPRGQPEKAVGQLWAIYFDGETGDITAVKEAFPIRRCEFSSQDLDVKIGTATLDGAALKGVATSARRSIRWSLNYAGDQAPVLLLPRTSYERGFPRAKALVGLPLARYTGRLEVDGADVPVEDWIGSQNHNWGSQHTDRYAWGQVAGFDNEPDAFLECSTARLKFGPFWTPRFTNVVLRYQGHTYALTAILQALRASGRYEYFHWTFASRNAEVSIRGEIEAPRDRFVGLLYENPPGGYKTCLNTKLARCQVTFEAKGQKPVRLDTACRAAFEILTDDTGHGVSVLAQ
jgi:hypothetical protein